MKKVYILRGVAGAGKSTYAANKFPSAYVVSADNYWIKPDGSYIFELLKLPLAHAECLRRFIRLINVGVAQIVVDNTNTRLWEFKTYIEYARSKNYSISVIRLNTPAEVAGPRNIHGVPQETVNQMQARFENYEGEVFINA